MIQGIDGKIDLEIYNIIITIEKFRRYAKPNNIITCLPPFIKEKSEEGQ